MVKVTTSRRRKKSLANTMKKEEFVLKKNVKVFDHDPVAELLDEDFIAKVIWECLKNNDPEGVLEAIETHLYHVNKTKASANVGLPKTTMYHAMRSKNPTIKTLSKLVNCCM